jgi:hypothetical protein
VLDDPRVVVADCRDIGVQDGQVGLREFLSGTLDGDDLDAPLPPFIGQVIEQVATVFELVDLVRDDGDP